MRKTEPVRPTNEMTPTYRMIAIDLDGTLLSPTGKVTARTKAAVHRALDAGLLVCFATGRSWTESRTVLEAVDHYDTAVFVGGAMVVDTKKQVMLHRTMMEPELARQLCGFLETRGHAAMALQDPNASGGVDYLVSKSVALNPATQVWMDVTDAQVRPTDGLSDYGHEHTVRVGTVAAPHAVATLKQALADQFAERIFCQSIFVQAYDVDVLEVFDPSVNKWEGIKHVAARHGIDPSQIIAVGDDVNDLHMIQHAGLGVAMGNGRPEAKALAKRIIGSNKDDGLAEFLEELVASGAVEKLRE